MCNQRQSLYFHDLGMLVSSREFDCRLENPEFVKFYHDISNEKRNKDYFERVKHLSNLQQEKFFFQEYIRYKHPSRIKDWIMGSDKYIWTETLKPVIMEIEDVLKPLPPRFRASLALVCESHHLNDLSDHEKYPLFETFGQDEKESANIQYAAIILRTADLLHVTKDRTPSIMFNLLEISDPLGILEWEKQLGTFSVSKAKRKLDEEDPKSLEIIVRADFDDERPFFSLSEYVNYADNQLKQSKKWIEKSSQDKDGADYLFPWQSVKADIRVEGNIPTALKFELDRVRLLDLLVGHTLYNDPTVVIRELLQNSIDAIRYKYFLDQKNLGEKAQIGRIEVTWNEENRTLEISDNGTGMDKYIIDNHLMKVGSSYYRSEEFINNNHTFNPISRFGIGILTCFMVSDDVEIITCKDNEAFRLKMSSVHSNYLLKEIDTGHKILERLEPNGTSG